MEQFYSNGVGGHTVLSSYGAAVSVHILVFTGVDNDESCVCVVCHAV